MLDADKYEIGANRAAKELNNAAIRQSTSTGPRRSTPTRSSRRHRAPGPAGRAALLRHLLQRVPGQLLAALDASSPTSRLTVRPHAAPARPSPSTSRWPTAARSASTRPTTETRRRRAFTFDLPLKPFVDGGWYWYDVVAGDEDAVVESAEWTAEVPDDRAEHGTVDHRDHHDEPAGLLRQAARPDRRRRPDSARLPRRGLRDGAGHPEGRRLPGLPDGRGVRSATSSGSSSRATSAAPAATPAASSSRSARARRRT